MSYPINEVYTDWTVIIEDWVKTWGDYGEYSTTTSVQISMKTTLNNFSINSAGAINLNFTVYADGMVFHNGDSPGTKTYRYDCDWVLVEPDTGTSIELMSLGGDRTINYPGAGWTIINNLQVNKVLPDVFKEFEHKDWQLKHTAYMKDNTEGYNKTNTITHNISVIDDFFNNNVIFFGMNF